MRILLFLLLLWPLALSAQDCHKDVACELGTRSYHVLEPDDWDGVSALPVLLHFHGWARQGDLIVNHDRIAAHTRTRGVLLVAPNGIKKTWSFWHRSRDVDFGVEILADLENRYPIDRDKIYVSGYSFGSAMAWRFACEEGSRVAALLAIAGTLDQTETCPEAPKEVRHVHGLDDKVMHYPIGAGRDRLYPVQLWRDHYGCQDGKNEGTYAIRSFLRFTRYTWDCDGGQVTFDQHAGGHFIPHGWIGWQLDQLQGRAPRYP